MGPPTPGIDPPHVIKNAYQPVIKLNCLLANIRSLKSKIWELNYIMSVADSDLVLLCETWLSDTILDRMIVSNKFRIFRQDRLSRLGEGSVLYVETMRGLSINVSICRHASTG